MRVLILVAMLLVIAGTSLPVRADAPDRPRVETRTGPVLGRSEQGLQVFRGLPYAAAPTGGNRWMPPQPVAAWNAPHDAGAFGPACLQQPGFTLADGGAPGAQSEDCLSLNVWTPGADPAAKRPVMVWIHGGALVFGSGSSPLYHGHALARRDAVVVTINYRLGPLGFFAHPALGDAGPVNFGLLDQVAALRWVRDNIEAFGGDPGNVTIFGQSAGGQSVLALFASPMARGLFHKGIVHSAYGIPSHTRAKAAATAAVVADAVGLPGADATAAQLRAVPGERLMAIADPAASLAPGFIVGDAVLPETILGTFQRGRQAKLPLVIGNTSDDASVALAFGLDPAALVQKLRAGRVLVQALHPGVEDDARLGREVVRDLVFTAYARRIAYLQSAHAPTWRFHFGYLAPERRGRDAGVPHGGDLPYFLGTGASCGCLARPHDAADASVSGPLVEAWVNFARDGRPRADALPDWPRDGQRTAQVMAFDAQPALRTGFLQRRLTVYIGLLKAAGGVLAPR